MYKRQVELNEALLAAADCVVVVTDHSAYDWQWIVNHARLIIDARNAVKSDGAARVVRL